MCLTLVNDVGAGKAKRFEGHRWLVAACETKVLLQDITGNSVIDIPRSLFESKTPTCLAALYLPNAPPSTGELSSHGPVAKGRMKKEWHCFHVYSIKDWKYASGVGVSLRTIYWVHSCWISDFHPQIQIPLPEGCKARGVLQVLRQQTQMGARRLLHLCCRC